MAWRAQFYLGPSGKARAQKGTEIRYNILYFIFYLLTYNNLFARVDTLEPAFHGQPCLKKKAKRHAQIHAHCQIKHNIHNAKPNTIPIQTKYKQNTTVSVIVLDRCPVTSRLPQWKIGVVGSPETCNFVHQMWPKSKGFGVRPNLINVPW